MDAAARVSATVIEPEKPEILTVEEVKRIVSRRLSWYGLDRFAIKSVERLCADRIEVRITDMAATRTFVRVFDVHPAVTAPLPAAASRAIAA